MRTFTFAPRVALAAVLTAASVGRGFAADDPSAVLTADDFARAPGLDKAVNDPALAERPVVEVDAQGKLRVRVQFKPFVLTDADGAKLELAAPDGWPAAYAALAQGKAVAITLTLPVGGGPGVRVRHALRGAPQAKAQVAYTRVTVTDEAGRTVAADTVAKLGATRDGLAELLTAPKFWVDETPVIADGALALRLRPLPAAAVGGFRWRFEWSVKGPGPLEAALSLHAGKKPTVTLALVPKDRPKEVAFRVAVPLAEYPLKEFAPAQGVRVVHGKDTLHEARGLEKLTDPELFWTANYALPPVVADGTLVFGLKPYDFRDVRGEPVAVAAPAEGWVAFYRRVRAGEKVSLAVPPKGLDPIRDAVLPPPGTVLVTEPAVARVREGAAPFLALVPGEAPRTVPLVRRGEQLYWGDRAEVGRPVGENLLFVRVTPEGKPARWALAALAADKNEALPRAQSALRGVDDWLKFPTELSAEDGAKVRVEHRFGPEWGYAARGWSVELVARKGKLALTGGLPVDLRFAQRVTVATEKYSYTLEQPFSAGKPEDASEGTVKAAAVEWWATRDLGPPDTSAETVLVIDGSLPDRTRARERLGEWERWQDPLAAVRKAEGPKLAVGVARNGDIAPAGKALGDPAGADPFLETPFPIALRNVLARHPRAQRVVIWTARSSLLEKPSREWVGEKSPRVELLRVPDEAKPDEISELLKRAVEP